MTASREPNAQGRFTVELWTIDIIALLMATAMMLGPLVAMTLLRGTY